MDCTAERLALVKAGPPGLPDTRTRFLELGIGENRNVVLRCASEQDRDAWYEVISRSTQQDLVRPPPFQPKSRRHAYAG